MRHGRPDRAWMSKTAEVYGGTHAGAWRGDLMGWRGAQRYCVLLEAGWLAEDAQ